MAIETIKKKFETFLSQEIKNLKSGFFVGPDDILYATVGGKDFIEAIKKGAEAICKAHDKNLLAYNTDTYWNTAVTQVSRQLKAENKLRVSGGATYHFATGAKFKVTGNKVTLNSGVYVERLTATTIELAVVTSTSDASRDFIKVEKVFDALKNAVWNKWVERLNKELGENNVAVGGSTETTRGGRVRSTGVYQYVGKSKKFGTLLSANVKRAHTGQTTTTVLALERVALSNPTLSGMGVTVQFADIAGEVAKNLKIDYAKERRKKKGITNKQINLIEVRLASNVAETSKSGKARDKRGILKAAETYIRNQISIKQGELNLGFDDEGSKSFKDSVIDDAVNILVEGVIKRNKKRVKKLDLKTTKSPEINEKNTVYKGKGGSKAKDKRLNLNLPGKIASTKADRTNPETGQEGINLLTLKRKINQRLPAEIRRNMGRPALINRTGRFSNSAELTDLREGPNSYIGKYTYQLDPYITFENLGKRKWPTGYNPKPLIAKSIRNLAMQYTEQQFTLRRG